MDYIGPRKCPSCQGKEGGCPNCNWTGFKVKVNVKN